MVGAEPGDIETQGRAVVALQVDNQHRTAELSRNGSGMIRWGEPLELTVRAPDAESIEIVQATDVIAKVSGPEGKCVIEPRTLGLGPVRLQAIATAARREDRWRSPPLELMIEPNDPLPPTALERGEHLAQGFIVRPGSGPPTTIVLVKSAYWLADANVTPNSKFNVEGYLDLEATDTYQFHLRHRGSLTMSIDGKQVYMQPNGDYLLKMVPIALVQGVHRVELSGQTGMNVEMEVGFGGPGVRPLNGTTLRHRAK
ncbi:MAG TPA: hypothetical protein VG713_12960 [Pirellulales bacterium]|nr:hypothetical protein [Pirellulales bacterium]